LFQGFSKSGFREVALGARLTVQELNGVDPQLLLDELKSLAASGDPEIAHSRADEILVTLIRWNERVGDLDEFDGDEIADAFMAVPRWYA
jgi:hypothetical protein